MFEVALSVQRSGHVILPGLLETEFGSTVSAEDYFIDDIVLDKSLDFSVNSIGMIFDLVSVFVAVVPVKAKAVFAHLITPARGDIRLGFDTLENDTLRVRQR